MTDQESLHKGKEHFKDACNYSVEVSKQFITLASAGCAFLIGLVITMRMALGWILCAPFLLLILSLGLGLFYLMRVVSRINDSGNYDVYSPQLRWVASFQIIAFLAAFVLIAFVAVKLGAAKAERPPGSSIYIHIGDKEIKQEIPAGSQYSVTVSDKNEIRIQIDDGAAARH